MPRIVLDTNVLVAAFQSRQGASFRLLAQVGTGAFDVVVSVPLVLEYEEVLARDLSGAGAADGYVRDAIDYLCSVAVHQEIFFLWRPVLRDPGDDLVLEVAVAAGCEVIVTHNVRDFDRARQFGVRAVSSGIFLNELRGAK
jgi:putative PIN family toxin of toxin-antitoxin system